jgi:hypothetical protein
MASHAANGQATTTATDRQEVVYVLGILQRSGTNYLADLLELHPQCGRTNPIGEDFLLAHADHLESFARSVGKDWNRIWDPDGRLNRELLARLGEACVSFVASKMPERPGPRPRWAMTKTPSVKNLHLLPLFPRTRAVVIVRDGRDMVASGMKSFGWDFEGASRQWAEAARTIEAARSAGVPFLLVRYEDLLKDLRGELTKVFAYLEIDPGDYDFTAAANLPVKGSSSFGTDKGTVHWRPVEKTESFNPVKRWAGWGAERHERFNWIAGAESVRLGYEPVGGGRSLYWNGWNHLQDLKGKLSRVRGLARRVLVRRKKGKGSAAGAGGR